MLENSDQYDVLFCATDVVGIEDIKQSLIFA